MAAARIAAALQGGKAQRESAYAELGALAAARGGDDQLVLAACVAPLAHQFAADLSSVDEVEFQRAYATLAEMMFADPLAVGAKYFGDGTFDIACCAAGNAYSAIWAKQPEELSRSDAMTLACKDAPNNVAWARGADAMFTEAGITGKEWLGKFMAHNRLAAAKTDLSISDAFVERLSLLLLDIVREPQGTSDVVVGGAWFTLSVALSGNPEALAALLQAGFVETAVLQMQQASPVDSVSSKEPAGVIAAGISNCFWTVSVTQLPGLNVTQLLVESGVVEVAISSLRAYELRGASKVEETSVVSVWGCLQVRAPSPPG
jgi:hypothetical protein